MDVLHSAAGDWLTLTLTYWNTEVDHLINIFPFNAGTYYFNTFPNQWIVNPTLAQGEALIGNERIQGPSLQQLYSNPTTTPYAVLDARRTNLGHEYIEGVDFNLNYKQSVPFGAVTPVPTCSVSTASPSEACRSQC